MVNLNRFIAFDLCIDYLIRIINLSQKKRDDKRVSMDASVHIPNQTKTRTKQNIQTDIAVSRNVCMRLLHFRFYC